MNGGLYPDLHRPQPAQVALLWRTIRSDGHG